MFRNLINFLKYNNLTVFMVLVVFLFSTGVFAQTEAGQQFIGEKETNLEGVDNTLLLEADLDNMDMDFKIEKIESDDNYYYVTYTFLDMVKKDNAWQYMIQEKIRKVSKKIKKDLGDYLAEELREEYEKRISELKEEKDREQISGETVRTELEEYTGIIGQTLDVVGKVFTGYDPVKKRQMPSPSLPLTVLAKREAAKVAEEAGTADNLTDVYNDYINKRDPDHDEIFGDLDNCPNDYNPAQLDGDDDGIGDVCDNDEPVIDDNEVVDPVDDEITTPDDGSSSDEPEHELGETVPSEDVPEETSNTSEESSSSEESSPDPGSESTDNSNVSTATEEPDVVIVEIEE